MPPSARRPWADRPKRRQRPPRRRDVGRLLCPAPRFLGRSLERDLAMAILPGGSLKQELRDLPVVERDGHPSSPHHGGGSAPICSNVHECGSRSSRQRTNVAEWRNRPLWTRSYVTSHTRIGSSETHELSRPADHRLGPPGERASPPNPAPPTSGASCSSSVRRSAARNDDVCPT